jgi:hypothetical protein
MPSRTAEHFVDWIAADMPMRHETEREQYLDDFRRVA